MTLIPNAQIIGRWRAAYAWSAEWGNSGLTVRYFRRRFTLDILPESFIVYITADSRYKLWINGECVGRGPLKGTLEHYHYEAYDLHAYLQAGLNVIAVEVRWFGVDTPVSEVHSHRPAFLLQGPDGAEIDTPGGWLVYVDQAVTPDTTHYISNALKFLGHMERVDARLLPHHWTSPGFDDAQWLPTVGAGPADVAGSWGELHPIQSLFPRDVPALEESKQNFTRIVRYTGNLISPESTPVNAPHWELSPGEGGELVLDAGALTTGYPIFHFNGGEERRIQITYSECVVSIEDRGGYRINHKALRDDFTFGDVEGYRDTVILPGSDYIYEPFHWRTFWYLRIQVSAGDTSFELDDVHYRFTTYSQKLQATFNSSLVDSQKLWDISWRTLQLCAHETYEDCPYFEQLNYIADTRLQAWCSMVLAGETALPRRSIRLYRDSVRAEGLVESRVPSVIPQVKPYFALLWILMVEDYWRWTGDRQFTHSNLNIVDSVLWFFREYIRPDGFIGKLPYWHMVDRVSGWPGGTPPAVKAGPSTYITSLYITALDAAVRLHQAVGYPQDGKRWEQQRDHMREVVRGTVWNERAGLFLEGPGRHSDGFSQHSQAVAILAGIATQDQQKRILKRLTSDTSLYRMKFMQSYYLARALEMAGGYSAFATHVLSLWRGAMDKRVTTWPEYPDPTRSDCHAWSSWIAADFITCILGVRPLTPGYSSIRLEPHFETGYYAEGSAPTPVGTVTVSWHKKNDQDLVLNAAVPQGIPTILKLPGIEPLQYPQGGDITYTGPIILSDAYVKR